MKKITSLFVWKVINQAENTIDKAELLRSLGIDPEASIDPSHMVSAQDYYQFIETLIEVDNNPTTLPLRTGAAMRCDDYGAFGLAWKSAINLRGCYDRAERYGRTLTNVSTYQTENTPDGVLMHLHREGQRHLGMRVSNEATIASIYSISQEVSTKEFTPLAVFFKHAAPKSISAHENYFSCPVHFDSVQDALLVSAETLDTPNKLGDESISQFFEAHLEKELSTLSDENVLHKRVKIQISQSLSDGIPTISFIAKQLGMSARTLQRKLSDNGYTYQQLIDDSRRELAERLLQESNYSLADVAFMTGFTEQSTFTRAFKRWSGQTPRSFRIKISSALRQ